MECIRGHMLAVGLDLRMYLKHRDAVVGPIVGDKCVSNTEVPRNRTVMEDNFG